MSINNTTSKLKKILDLAGNAIMMNLAFIVACLPVVTIGQAWCGLYSAVRYTIRGDKWWRGFKVGFKTRFLRGTIAWIICLAADLYLGINTVFNIYYQWAGNEVSCVLQALCLLLTLMITAALIPLNVYIPTDVLQWVRNAVNLTVKAPLYTAIAACTMFLPVVGLVMMMYDLFFFFVFALGFLAVYFSVAVLINTIALKDPLIKIKLEMEAMQAEDEDEEETENSESENTEAPEEEE